MQREGVQEITFAVEEKDQEEDENNSLQKRSSRHRTPIQDHSSKR